jgi:hypothetical protein
MCMPEGMMARPTAGFAVDSVDICLPVYGLFTSVSGKATPGR